MAKAGAGTTTKAMSANKIGSRLLAARSFDTCWRIIAAIDTRRVHIRDIPDEGIVNLLGLITTTSEALRFYRWIPASRDVYETEGLPDETLFNLQDAALARGLECATSLEDAEAIYHRKTDHDTRSVENGDIRRKAAERMAEFAPSC